MARPSAVFGEVASKAFAASSNHVFFSLP